MALLTTTIGAYPKPNYVSIPDWFKVPNGRDHRIPTVAYAEALASSDAKAEDLFVRATHEVVRDQVEAGVDIPTDGEIRRENYIYYHCRHLQGFDFEQLEEHVMRGFYRALVPTVTGRISVGEPFLPRDWRVAQEVTERPVKITLPGPMTIADSTVDRFYGNPVKLGEALAKALNAEVRALAKAGCSHIQVDEPLFARRPAQALDYGLQNLVRCFDGLPQKVTKITHVCCGYPDRLDDPDYPKAPKEAYLELAEALDAAPLDQVSLEDAHRHNDLSNLLPRFRNTTIVLGVVAIAKSRVETVEEIHERITLALRHVEKERLLLAPDCGLVFLGRRLALDKLRNMTAAARLAA